MYGNTIRLNPYPVTGIGDVVGVGVLVGVFVGVIVGVGVTVLVGVGVTVLVGVLVGVIDGVGVGVGVMDVKVFQYPLFVNQILASVAEENVCGDPYSFATYSAILIKELSVKSSDLKNPTDAETPDISVGWVFPETGTPITYPKSSSGPIHQVTPPGLIL
jgi:hypothetical protein